MSAFSFQERAVLPDGVILELSLFGNMHYRLILRIGRKFLVKYKGNAKRQTRTVRGYESAYPFKSVEKLRYDFERDVEDALRQG